MGTAPSDATVSLNPPVSGGGGSPGSTVLLPGQTPEGEYILSVLVKRTYVIRRGERCERAEKDLKLVSGDEFHDGPMNSSVRCESDFVPFKPATDVVFLGSARVPEGKQVVGLKPKLTVGTHSKEILALGNRTLTYRPGKLPAFGDPEVFTEMELRYERAYGGVDVFSDPSMQVIYPRNHVGKGFVIENVREAVETAGLPNLEDPNDLLTPERLCVGHFMHWERQPMPQGFSWTAKHWRPRSEYAGVMPADRETERQLREIYAKAVPEEQRELYEQTGLPDMDFRFFNGAPLGLAVPYLGGDEDVELKYLTPERLFPFSLPGETPRIGLDYGEGRKTPEVVLQTVQIRGDEMEVDLVWRGAVPYPGPDWLPEMKKLEIEVE